MVNLLFSSATESIPHSLRFFTILWLIYSMVLSYFYSSSLAFFMTELLLRPRLNSIEELAIAVRDGEYVPAVSAEGSLYKFVKEIRVSPINAISDALIIVNQINKAMKLMASQMTNLVYICPRILFNARSGVYGSLLFNIPPKTDDTTFVVEQLSIALPKNCQLKTQINKL